MPDQDALDALVDMREFDVPYHMRFQIDTDVRCGHWFTVRAKARALPVPACLTEYYTITLGVQTDHPPMLKPTVQCRGHSVVPTVKGGGMVSQEQGG